MLRLGILRWIVLLILIGVNSFLYFYRIEIGLLAPLIREDLDLPMRSLSAIMSAYTFGSIIGAIALGFVLWGIGTRWFYLIVIGVSSFAAMASGLAAGATGLVITRGLLGAAAGGNLPAVVQSIREWFPQKLRGIAIGLVIATAQVVALVAPLAEAPLASSMGWKSVFLITGASGLLWIPLWALLVKRPTELPQASAAGPNPLGQLTSWLYILARFITDPVWFLLVAWIPAVIDRGEPNISFAYSGAIISSAAVGGALIGGLLSDLPAMLGKPSRRVRAFMVGAVTFLLMLAGAGAWTQNPLTILVLGALGTAAYQMWSVNLYASIADAVPERGVGLVVAMGGAFSGLAIILFSAGIPVILRDSFNLLFLALAVLPLLGFPAALFMTLREPITTDDLAPQQKAIEMPQTGAAVNISKVEAISKPLYFGSVLAATLVMGAILCLVVVLTLSGNVRGEMLSVLIGSLVCVFVLQVYGIVMVMILWHKAWSAIQDTHARTTPGKAIGFALIPLFNFYWVFQLCLGFAKDYNAYVRRYSIPAPELSQGLFLWASILPAPTFLLAQIPFVGMAVAIPATVIGLIVTSRVCDAINALARSTASSVSSV